MDTAAFLDYLKGLPFYRQQIVHVEHIPPAQPAYGELERPLPAVLEASLSARGLLPLYRHQAAAINLARSRQNVMVVTPAASGKTLCYNVPVLETLLVEKGSRALYLFPTKALAQDQLRGLGELAAPERLRLRFATFDGDTPQSERSGIKRSSHIVLSNPDMLHLGILPNHRTWSGFLSCLKYVVVDEAHSYRGVFGSHVANILRRLRRLCSHYGSAPQFICCSATIANPAEHAQRLTGLPFQVVAEDGSPHGGKEFVFWNPPLIDQARATRRSPHTEATFLLSELVGGGIRSLAFARSRRAAELIYVYVRDQLGGAASELGRRIRAYRAGYLPEERREIERELFDGELLAAVATTALELGIDIGDLEATVLTGYPGSIASTWQQAGRSGRGREDSLSFLIGLDNPLDQYFMRHPEFFFDQSHESALIDPENPHILGPHLLCAAWERPLSAADAGLFGSGFAQTAQELESRALLRKGALRGRSRWFPVASVAYPAEEINIRSISAQSYALVEASSGRLLETVEESSAFFRVHPGAVYLHQGEPYLVMELDLPSRTAYALPTDAPYYTQTKDLTDLKVLGVSREKTVDGIKAYLGRAEVTTSVIGFKKKRIFTEEVIGEEPLDLPPQSFPTVAVWFDLPALAEKRLAEVGADFHGGLHAAEHACIALLPLFALCDRNDIGGVSTPLHPDTGRPQVFIYDAYPGGIGIAERGFELIAELWQATLRTVSECPCEEGCPGCVQSPKCGNNNQPLDKRAARLLLEWLVAGLRAPGAFPQGPPRANGGERDIRE